MAGVVFELFFIRHRIFSYISAVLLALCICALQGCNSCSEKDPPSRNTLIIFVDTLRADHLGAYGYNKPTSPFLDTLAAEGVMFNSAYAPTPWTYSSVASLFTGLYPTAHNAIIPGRIRNEAKSKGKVTKLNPGAVTMADIANKAGIKTALIARNSYLGHGIQKGFRHYDNEKGRNAAQQTDLAIEWIKQLDADDRFLMVVHYMDVHQPNRSRSMDRAHFPSVADLNKEERKYYRRWDKKYANANPEKVRGYGLYRPRRIGMYDASIRYVDSQIERLVESLGKRKDDTLIIFLSDHGEEFWDHHELESRLWDLPPGRLGQNHGHTFFEEMVRVPLLVHQPGLIKPGVIKENASLLDVLPTVADLMEIPDTAKREGVSLAPALLRKGKVPDRPLIFDAVCYGHDKQGLLDSDLKFIQSWNEPSCLLDLENDPSERKNAADGRKSDVKAMSDKLQKLLQASRALGDSIRGGKKLETHQFDKQELKALQALGYFEDDSQSGDKNDEKAGSPAQKDGGK